MPRKFPLPFGWTIDSIKNLQEERDELKAENTQQSCEILDLQKENEKLKNEIEEYWKVDDEAIGGFVSGSFKSIGEHLKACFEEKERIRKRFVETNKEFNKLKEENENRSTLSKDEVRELLRISEHRLKQIDELFDATDYPVDIIGDGYSKVDAIYEWVHNRDEEIDELKKQIPKKPRKCFSYNDKARLSRVRDILGSFSDDDKASDDPTEDDWYDDETLKLLDRLIK
jgi:chromosome segregation ATPase